MAETAASTIGAGVMKDIIDNAYGAISSIEGVRETLMGSLESAAGADSNKVISIAGNTVDISTGAGALVLDNYLQELSTVEQAAAQIVAQTNKAQKTVHSQTGQV